MQLKWRISHARGYLALGLVEEASAELDGVPESEREEIEVLALRALIFQERKQWAELEAAARVLVERQPEDPGWWIMHAYATRRARSLAAAEEILLQAEMLFPNEGTIQFNLGCYACLRGDLAAARMRVDRAIQMDDGFREAAASDPDLAALRAIEA